MERFTFSGAKGAAEGLRERLGLLRDVQTVRYAQDREARERNLPDPKPAEPVCLTHDWRPVLSPGQPRPPASLCPECQKEAAGAHVRSPEEERSLVKPVEVSIPKDVHEYNVALEEHERKRPAKRYPRGSFAERAERSLRRDGYDAVSSEVIEELALERMDVRREEERARLDQKHHRSPAYVSGMYTSGSQEQIAIMRRPWRRGGMRILG